MPKNKLLNSSAYMGEKRLWVNSETKHGAFGRHTKEAIGA